LLSERCLTCHNPSQPEGFSIKEPALASKSWWSFQPVQRPAPPGLPAEWSANPIDRLIHAKLCASGLPPAPDEVEQTEFIEPLVVGQDENVIELLLAGTNRRTVVRRSLPSW